MSYSRIERSAVHVTAAFGPFLAIENLGKGVGFEDSESGRNFNARVHSAVLSEFTHSANKSRLWVHLNSYLSFIRSNIKFYLLIGSVFTILTTKLEDEIFYAVFLTNDIADTFPGIRI
mmetsp:Transcript_4361/g.7782  ORF Transcript_4361/g.7782 Transcript_4361/m.7782 type:complete len:118 (+) Transcript_4361:160-513(+)